MPCSNPTPVSIRAPLTPTDDTPGWPDIDPAEPADPPLLDRLVVQEKEVPVGH